MAPDMVDGVSMSGSSGARFPSLVGRSHFLLSTRRVYPEFWQSLNEIWRGRDRPALQKWLEDRGVVDDWLIGAVDDTLMMWDSEQDGPNAQLQKGYLWYCWESSAAAPDFEPKFEEPYPTYTGPEGLSAQEISTTPAA